MDIFPSREELEKTLSIYDNLTEEEKTKMDEEQEFFDRKTEVSTIQRTKVYSWIRLYSKEDIEGFEPGDEIEFNYLPTSEKLILKFGSYNKKGLNKDNEDEITEYISEDDKKVLCILAEVNEIEKDDSVPFLRSMFKSSKYYSQNIFRTWDLKVKNLTKDIEVDYYTIDF